MEFLRSVLPSALILSSLFAVAAVLTVRRDPRQGTDAQLRRVQWILGVGILVQFGHMMEEYVTGFHVRWPEFFQLEPWSGAFFLRLNSAWILIWILCAVAIKRRVRIAFVPVWFFALAMTLNGVAHPALAAYHGGYFPGLWTSPLAGVIGVVLIVMLLRLTPEETVPRPV